MTRLFICFGYFLEAVTRNICVCVCVYTNVISQQLRDIKLTDARFYRSSAIVYVTRVRTFGPTDDESFLQRALLREKVPLEMKPPRQEDEATRRESDAHPVRIYELL